MDKIKKMKSLIEELNSYAYEYYTLDTPTITDKEYDEKYNNLETLEKETNIILPNSPTQKVGSTILKEFKQVNHKNKLWSLDKSQSIKELKQWHNKNVKFCNKNNLPTPEYIVTKKYDGLTLKIDYDENGNYSLASTRGNGEIGEDVTLQAKTIINLPLVLNDLNKSKISVHGEGLMTKKAFEEYNQNAKTPLKNLRNGVAGAIRNLNPKETAKRKCIIKFYNINDSNIEFKTYEEQLIYMSNIGLPTCEYSKCISIEEVINEINSIENKRLNLPYDIDGVVISLNDINTRNKIGFTSKFPNHSIAYKFEPQEVSTKILDVEWNVGKTGRINPTAILEPVELMGSTISRATLNNISDINKKDIKINSTILLRKSNDVIPEITGVLKHYDNSKNIIPPTTCPICGSKTYFENDILYCSNDLCDGRLLQKLTHFASRDCMNIKGLSEKTMEQFIEKGIITSLEDIYSLECHKDEILKLPKFGQKKYDNLIQAIEESKHVKLSNFITALGIPNVGKSTAISLANTFTTIDGLMKASFKDITDVKDIGDETGNAIYNFFRDEDNLKIIKTLLYDITIEQEEVKEMLNLDNPFSGKKVYATGTFENDYKKSEIKELIEYMGGTFKYSKSSLDYLIVGNKKGSSKVNEASKNGTIILTEDEFIKILKDCGLGK